MKFLFILVVIWGSFQVDGFCLEDYKYYFYYSGGVDKYNTTTIPSILTNTQFSNSKPTVLYFHGILMEKGLKLVEIINDAYVSSGYNVIMFEMNVLSYHFLLLEKMSKKVADDFLTLFKNGLNITTFEVVGFSIGAHFAGYFGREIQSKSSGNFTIPRIVGLDPTVLTSKNLRESDATFVMTVHTNNYGWSNPDVVGHIGFFVNGGETQPMCDRMVFFWINDMTCSHFQALYYWKEAVESNSPTIFPARKCNDYENFKANNCSLTDPVAYMNLKTSSTMRGKYFLNTNNKSPYSKPTADP